MTWQDQLQSLAQRVGEPDLFTPSVNTEQLTPYFEPDVTERFLYRACLYFLRMTTPQELDAIGSSAIQTVTATTGAGVYVSTTSLPLGTIRPLDATIDPGSGAMPAEWTTPDIFFQMLTCAPNEGLIYTAIGGKLAVRGAATLTLRVLIEPPLTAFQADLPILPPGYVEGCIDRAKKYMMISDYLPAGRL